MAVSKRLRFEILRRDNHTCRYCGRSAPEVSLTIDHVVPEALGGTDDPENLVAACPDCNGGKSSVPPDSALVANVSADAERWAAAMRLAAEELKLNDNTAVYDAVINAWTSYRRRQIPKDYRETIDQFLKAGLPADDIIQMAHVADAKPNVYNRWAYFCGCCWKRISALQERASQIFSEAISPNIEQLQQESAPVVDLRPVTRWFKPVWYGEAWEAGRRRWARMHVDSIAQARQEAADLGLEPEDQGYVDSEGRIYMTDAPRPGDWIETVARFLDAGLSKAAIAETVRSVMRSSDTGDLWPRFVDCCEKQVSEVLDG